jgi:hypothetical protein
MLFAINFLGCLRLPVNLVMQATTRLIALKAHKDFNAAQNILALGLDGLGAIPRSLRL